MATKEKLKTKAARVREEARETGKVILRAPALVRAAECVIRFLLGAMLSGAEIFGGYAPFGLGLVAASGSGLDGFCALLGACFGYLSFQGFAEGLRYVAGCILAFSLAFAFFDVKAYRKSWFMPLAAAGMDGITGFVYLSDRGWSPEGLIFFGTELLLCGASAYFYRIAFTPWTEKREEEGLTPRQTVSLLILAGTLLLTLSKITLLGDLSVGRCAAAAAVMATAYKGGIGVGATVGVACGLGMDLAAGGMPFYSMAFALSGVMCGVFHRQGRLAAALAYVFSGRDSAELWGCKDPGSGPWIELLYRQELATLQEWFGACAWERVDAAEEAPWDDSAVPPYGSYTMRLLSDGDIILHWNSPYVAVYLDGEGQIWRCTSGYDQLYRSLAERWAWKVAQGTPGYFSALTDEDGPALLAGAEGDRPLPDPGAVEAAMEALTWTPVEPAPAEEPEGVTVTDASGYYRMTFCPGNLVYYYMDDYWNFWFQGTGEAELYPLLLEQTA